jgi:hypothetical protein
LLQKAFHNKLILLLHCSFGAAVTASLHTHVPEDPC